MFHECLRHILERNVVFFGPLSIDKHTSVFQNNSIAIVIVIIVIVGFFIERSDFPLVLSFHALIFSYRHYIIPYCQLASDGAWSMALFRRSRQLDDARMMIFCFSLASCCSAQKK